MTESADIPPVESSPALEEDAEMTPVAASPAFTDTTPSVPASTPTPTATAAPTATANGKKKAPPKKTSQAALERRRLGRLKAAETMARKIKDSGILRKDNKLKYSNFEPLTLINQKNYVTDYLKKDEQFLILRERRQMRLRNQKANKEKNEKERSDTPSNDIDDVDGDLDMDDDLDNAPNDSVSKNGSKTVVIHPGSKNIRIGFATDFYPKTFPFVVAVPKKCVPAGPAVDDTDDETTEEEAQAREELILDFKERMKFYKRRIIPNSSDVVANFNKKAKPQVISELDDINKTNYIKSPTEPFYIGQDAINLVSDEYELRYPILTSGKFNEQQYNSVQEVFGEVQLFLEHILRNEFDTNVRKDTFKCTLIIPDLYDKIYVESWIELLLKMGFTGVALIQESLSGTYGANVTSACVIDIGATTSKVACVDEGCVMTNSRGVVNFGGDDLTLLFHKLLKESSFPIEFDKANPQDWLMMEELKEKFITFNDEEIFVQLFNFTKRYADKLSEKYEFKLFDEVMLTPMSLFFPKNFKKPANYQEVKFSQRKSVDYFTGAENNPVSLTQKQIASGEGYSNQYDLPIIKSLINNEIIEDGVAYNSPVIFELDKLIIQSITNASRYNITKAKSYYENLLLVGGSVKIKEFEKILIDRILINRPRILSLLSLPDLLKKVEVLVTKADGELAKTEAEEEKEKIRAALDSSIEQEISTLLENASSPTINVEVLPAPREMDPAILVWKGASVFSRLKLIEELWINENDWDLLGSRSLQHKLTFPY